MNAKRRKTNVQNLVWHFSPRRDRDQPKYWKVAPGVLDVLPPEQLLALMRAYESDRDAFEAVFSYCRRFKQAVGEITAEDIAEASSLVKVKEVLES